MPPYEITLPVLDKLNKIVDNHIEECIQDETSAILHELRNVTGFLNTDVKIDEIDERLNDVVNDDEGITKLDNKLKKLVKSIFNIEVD